MGIYQDCVVMASDGDDEMREDIKPQRADIELDLVDLYSVVIPSKMTTMSVSLSTN